MILKEKRGSLLGSTSIDRYFSLGEAGRPVYRFADQILSVLSRRNSNLIRFLAIPKSNERGSIIDWYSPLAGEVIGWEAASEEERTKAQKLLEKFKEEVKQQGQEWQQKGKNDPVIFGKLLELSRFCPSAQNIFLVSSVDGDGQPYIQPVLTFWGFVNKEEDRYKDPLYFLASRPRPVTPVSLPLSSSPSLFPTDVISGPLEGEVVGTNKILEEKEIYVPWWRKWWWIFLLLLLPLLFLLRECAPGLPGRNLPDFFSSAVNLLDTEKTKVLQETLPDVARSDIAFSTSNLSDNANIARKASIDSEQQASLPLNKKGEISESVSDIASYDDSPVQEMLAPSELPELPVAESSVLDAATRPTQKSEIAAERPYSTLPQSSDGSSDGSGLSIPSNAENGVANFLNGRYNAGAGIMDAQTSRPLRLEYRFENGRGDVTIRHPNGETCSGEILARMANGQLDISSQDHAVCTDGGHYDMPAVTCTPGNSSQGIVECSGAYGDTHFPMLMRRASE